MIRNRHNPRPLFCRGLNKQFVQSALKIVRTENMWILPLRKNRYDITVQAL